MKKFVTILIILFLAFVGYTLFKSSGGSTEETEAEETEGENTDITEGEEDPLEEEESPSETVIGSSANGNDITAYHYGTGDEELLFVGGIHGGYSWGTSLVAYELVDYLEANPEAVPENLRVTVIPVLNPDGLEVATGSTARFAAADVATSQDTLVASRFNANGVDLNRNFACEWQAEGTWRSTPVDAGDAAFSEPETEAVRNYINASDPEAVVVWYGAGGGVYASSCGEGVLPETSEIVNIYADASGYAAHASFDSYDLTGDMTNWLAREGTPAISVLLTTHGDTEWSKNRAGIEALLEHYGE